jgi:hypothetical protein
MHLKIKDDGCHRLRHKAKCRRQKAEVKSHKPQPDAHNRYYVVKAGGVKGKPHIGMESGEESDFGNRGMAATAAFRAACPYGAALTQT